MHQKHCTNNRRVDAWPASQDDRIKVLFICESDWANVSTLMAKAITEHSKIFQSKCICARAHPFQYRDRHALDYDTCSDTDKARMKEWARDVRIVIWAEEAFPNTNYYSYNAPNGTFLNTMLLGNTHLLRTARWGVWHAGNSLRARHKVYNALDNLHFSLQIASPDLVRNALPTAVPLIGSPVVVNMDHVREKWEIRMKAPRVVIVHSPTNYTWKGTAAVRQVAQRLEKQYPDKMVYLEVGGPYGTKENLPATLAIAMRSEGHIYIDQFNSDIGGIGQSSIESMATGMISLCTLQNIGRDVWDKQGICSDTMPLFSLGDSRSATAVDDLHDLLRDLILQPRERLRAIGMESALWVKQHFSPFALARYYEDNVLSGILQDSTRIKSPAIGSGPST